MKFVISLHLTHVINLAVQAKLGKGSLEAEAQKDAEYMDVEDDDDSAGFIRTSIAEEEDVVRIAPTTTTTPATDADIVDNNTSTKHALQKSRKGIVKIGMCSFT